jgi:hypothetical protein
VLLRRKPGAKASELAQWTNTSQPTISRMLAEVAPQVACIGRGPRRRYYGRRNLRGLPGQFPLYAVGRDGTATQVGVLDLIEPEGTVLDVAAMGWPVEQEFVDGVWPGLAYPLQDMRFQGFLGRGLARNVGPDLGVSSNPGEWGDDDVLFVLTQRGSDTSGNLILGDEALKRWLQAKAGSPRIPSGLDIERDYAQLANEASALGAVGSSAAGEFPKFTAMRELDGSQTPHVIVKFSGAEASGAVQRWSDLLVCEHLALQAAANMPGVQSADSRILQVQGRTLLEVERFDRHGLHGRSPLCSLETLDAAMLNKSSNDWGVLGTLLQEQGWITSESAHKIQLIWLFGKLIGNSDMHKGNLSFIPCHPVQVAPVYDMLPMMFAPLGGGEVPQVQYSPALPAPRDRESWLLACAAAIEFWRRASADARISPAFRKICAANQMTLTRLRDLA